MGMDRMAQQLLDNLEVGISLVSWHPEDIDRVEWIFVNEARCRLAGFTRDEIVAKPPIARTTRETRAQIEKTNEAIAKHGRFTCESTLLHRSNKALPVILKMKLIRLDGIETLWTEIHDISSFKETESMLKLSRESTREMLTLIEKEKQNITENIKNNLGLVLFPLMDQLRLSATDHQQEVLDLMLERIGQVGRKIGMVSPAGSPGFNLTRRQILICEMIRDGMTSKEIARVLNCAPSTINNHRNTIRKKLKLSGKSANLQAFLNSFLAGQFSPDQR